MAIKTNQFNWDQVPVQTAVTANPVAGQNPATQTVPAGKRRLYLGARCELVTDATVASRYGTLTWTDGTNTIGTVSTSAQTASLTRQHNFLQGAGVAYTSGPTALVAHLPVNGLELGPAYTLAFTFAGLVAGDDATAATFYFKEVPA